MSTDEQDAAILRLVKERAETKREKSLLENELRSFGRTLSEVGHALQHIGTCPSDVPKAAEKVAKAGNVPNMDKIIEMSREYAELDKP